MVPRQRAEITGAQVRAARGLLNLSIEALATHTGLAVKTIRRAERVHDEQVPINSVNAERIRSVLEERGAVFIAAGDGGAGVRLRIDPPPQWGDFKTVRSKATKETAKKDRAGSARKKKQGGPSESEGNLNMTSSEGTPAGRVGKVEAIGDDHGVTIFDAENRALATFTFSDAMEALHHEATLRAILRRATAVVAPRDVVGARDEIARFRRIAAEVKKVVGEALDALDGEGVPARDGLHRQLRTDE